ncbi:MAG: hypothetical protein KBE41_07605 [Lutibacter sp.]|nr:hypothetical protein [Lutibacter sp.]MBP9601354.1 hypothetical protein [Lutibacter sp.]
MNTQDFKEGKTIAIISYITFIGTIIAFIMNGNKRNSFASFHIRQAIGLVFFSFLNGLILSRYVGAWASGAIGFGIFVLWIIGLVGAVQGEEKKIPLFGDIFQDWFKGIA